MFLTCYKEKCPDNTTNVNEWLHLKSVLMYLKMLERKRSCGLDYDLLSLWEKIPI